MSTNPIHLMNLEEAEQTLTRYNTILNVRNSETNRLNHQLDLINDDTPELKDCIRILKIRIKELEGPNTSYHIVTDKGRIEYQ